MLKKTESRLIRTKPITEEDREVGIDVGYYPKAEGGPIAFYDPEDSFSVLHELAHAGKAHGHKPLTSGKPIFTEILDRELEAGYYVVEQLKDAGIWKTSYKEDLVDQLTGYFEMTDTQDVARKKALYYVSKFEDEAEINLKRRHALRRRLR